MSESQSFTIELFKMLTEFLTSNAAEIFILVALYFFKEPISGFISRLTSFNLRKGESHLGMEAINPTDIKEKNDLRTTDEKPLLEDKNLDIKENEEEWLSEAHKALSEGRLADADAAFRRYALEETDDIKLEKNKAFYLWFKYYEGKDISAAEDLRDLARTAKTVESKFNTLAWLSLCLRDGMQYEKETEVWRSFLAENHSEEFNTRAIVNLAYSLDREGSSIEAKSILTNRINQPECDTQKGLIFEALSKIEESLGNKSLAIYCKDKSLEFDQNNADELFSSAYSASTEEIDEISISNYLRLIRIDRDNSVALNNLGARAEAAGFKIKAIEHYKKSSEHNNTLAMANQGYLLLGAGFIDEAEAIAKDALLKQNPHQNIHSLLVEVNRARETQNKAWEDLTQKALNRQRMIREYTEQFYLGKPERLNGDWEVNGRYAVNIKVDNGLLKASWIETEISLGGGPYTVELQGKVSGSTFDGTYSRQKNSSSPSSLLGLNLNKKIDCIGYLLDQDGVIKVLSKKLNEDLNLSLSLKNTMIQ